MDLSFIFPLLFIIGKILLVVVPLLVCVAMLTLFERKVIAAIRKGLKEAKKICGNGELKGK